MKRNPLVMIASLLIAIPILLLAAPLVLLLTWWDDRKAGALRRAFEARHAASGARGLLVYSNSPHWQRYVEENWLPRIGDRLVVLNWSERATWRERHPLEGAVFARFGGSEEFNPLAVIFLPRERHARLKAWLKAVRETDLPGIIIPYAHERDVRVVRFYQPFRDFKHGKDRALRAAEAEMFAALEDG